MRIDSFGCRECAAAGLGAMTVEALAVCEAMFPELALVDVNLWDGANGVDVAHALLERWGVLQALDENSGRKGTATIPRQSSTDVEIALAEAIHRAQNDLGSIAAMLRLQARAMTDMAALLDAETRVRALASLNARLNVRAAGVESVVNSGAFLNGLAVDLRAMHFAQRPVTLDVRAEPHRLLVAQARTIGLIVNEQVVNALKYAFPDDRSGAVNIAFECRGGDCTLTVEDDGIGMDPAAPPRGTGLGRRMVRALAAQLGGSFQIGPGADGGTECTVRWRSPPGERCHQARFSLTVAKLNRAWGLLDRRSTP